MPERLGCKSHEEYTGAAHDQPLMGAVEAADRACADDADQDDIGSHETDERYAEKHRQRLEIKRAGRACDQRREGRERHRITLRIGDAEDQTAAKRPLDHNKRLPFGFRLGIDGTPADPGEIETAGKAEQIEDEGSDRLGPDDRDQRQRRPDDIPDQMPHHEEGAGLAALPGADAEQLEESRSRNEHIKERRQKGAEEQGLRHGNAPENDHSRLGDRGHPSRVVHCHDKWDQVANAIGGGFQPEADIWSLKDAAALRLHFGRSERLTWVALSGRSVRLIVNAGQPGLVGSPVRPAAIASRNRRLL